MSEWIMMRCQSTGAFYPEYNDTRRAFRYAAYGVVIAVRPEDVEALEFAELAERIDAAPAGGDGEEAA